MKFQELTHECAERVISDIVGQCSCAKEIIEELADELLLMTEDDLSVAVALSSSCLAVRIFDLGRYSFLFPFELCDDSDIKGAISEVGEYARREELPLVFCDVPAEMIGIFTSMGFRHIDIDAEDPEAASFRVSIKSECAMLDGFDTITGERLALSMLEERDIADYARLSRDESALKFWGYDYREDMPDATDAYFYEIAKREYSLGVALSLGARIDGSLCGEGIIYGFDCLGGAEFAIRLLPEYRGLGLGRELFELVLDAARKIGLIRLSCDILTINIPSVAMVEPFMEREYEDESKIRFSVDLR